MSETVGKQCGAVGAQGHTFKTYPNRETQLGNLPISRALPIRKQRLVGPWCFLDRFGPLAFADERPMSVPPHPHIGLQTVTWLLEGEVRHTDSLGQEAVVRPGGVNVMTAGRGIAHAEETPPTNSGRLNGVQLWVALPNEHRHTAPAFTSVAQVPVLEEPGGIILPFAGTLSGVSSPAHYFSEIIGLEAQVHPGHTLAIALDSHFEHALLLLDGSCSLEGQALEEKALHYLGDCRAGIELTSQPGCRILLIGGPPFPEKILMWWNFVARTPDEISQARDDWEAHRRFGPVKGTQLARLSAPDLARFARPNPAS